MLGLLLGCKKGTAFVFWAIWEWKRREDEHEVHTYRLGFVFMREWNGHAFVRLQLKFLDCNHASFPNFSSTATNIVPYIRNFKSYIQPSLPRYSTFVLKLSFTSEKLEQV
jgi:hypothetical protein